MRHLAAMLLLAVGTGLAAAFGSINGPAHTDYRTAAWAIDEAGAGVGREGSIAAMTEALPQLEQADLSDPEGLEPEARKTLYLLLKPFGMTLEDLTDPEAEKTPLERARETLAETQKAHTDRTEQLVETGFLVELTDKQIRAAAKELPPGVVHDAAGDSRWEHVRRKAENFALGSRKIEIVAAGGTELSEEDAALVAKIDAAIAGEDRAGAFAALSARGLPIEPVDEAKVAAELLNDPEVMQLLKDGDALPSRQAYDDRLAAAKSRITGKGDALLPEPKQRISQWASTGGLGWMVGVLLILAGALLARKTIADENAGTSTDGATSGKVDFQVTLDQAMARIEGLITNAADLPMEDDAPTLRAEIDAIQLELLDPLVDQRGRFMARHGLSVFAEYFSPFSATERNLARAWSALTDGHAVVARSALENARDSLQMADEAWKKAEASLTS